MRVFVPVEDDWPAGAILVPYRIGMTPLSFTMEPPSAEERAAAQAAPRPQPQPEPAIEPPLAA